MKEMFKMVGHRLSRLFTVAAVVAVAENSSAADKTFPGAGGNLADEVAWGSMVPSAADLVRINQPGDYMLSSNVTFKALENSGKLGVRP